jgi:hypothetical protein
MIHSGGCHCGAVRFEVEAPERVVALDCNCSLCAMTGFLHLIVPASRFRLLRGQDHLTTYTFGTRTAQHHFCRTCGIKSFYVPRSNPDGFDVNVRCLDRPPPELVIESFDGRDWEANGPGLSRLSREAES